MLTTGTGLLADGWDSIASTTHHVRPWGLCEATTSGRGARDGVRLRGCPAGGRCRWVYTETLACSIFLDLLLHAVQEITPSVQGLAALKR